MNAKNPWYKSKTVWKWIGIVFVAMFIFGKISEFTGLSDKLEEQKAEEKAADKAKWEEKAEEAKKQSAAVNERLAKAEAAEKERLAKRSDKEIITDSAKDIYGEDELLSVEYMDGVNVAVIKVKSDHTPGLMRNKTLTSTTKLLKELKNVAELKSVDVNVISTLTDQYGNKSDDKVMSISVSRAVIDKINFDNFNYKNLPDIADDYWEHPAMTK